MPFTTKDRYDLSHAILEIMMPGKGGIWDEDVGKASKLTEVMMMVMPDLHLAEW